jgi:hypothetical protein
MLDAKIPGIDVRSFMTNKAVLNMVMNEHLVSGMHTADKLSDGQQLQSRQVGSAGQLTIQKSG